MVRFVVVRFFLSKMYQQVDLNAELPKLEIFKTPGRFRTFVARKSPHRVQRVVYRVVRAGTMVNSLESQTV